MKCSSPVPAALMQPQTVTLPTPCLTVGKTCTLHLVAARQAWHHLNHISLPWSHQTTGHGSSHVIPCPYSARLQQTAWGLFLCIIFRRGFLLGWQPCRPIWCSVQHMVWALTGWPPTPFKLCSNAGSTHTSGQPLDMPLSTCTQLPWPTMVRPVLSGTCPVKPLYGLGHRAAAQFQGVGNFLLA